MKPEQIKKMGITFSFLGVTFDTAPNTLHSIASVLHRNECVKWALIIADLRSDPNTHPDTLKAAWEKFKLI